MTRLWAEGEPVEVTLDAEGAPRAFLWRGQWRPVAQIANCWRVQASWWADDAWREYTKLVTSDGMLATLYRDLRSGAWYCARVYD